MKSVVLIFSLLYLQASASFFDNFRGAFAKAENGFGKLLSEVAENIKDTIQCTISAVGHVLVQNGILDKTSAYKYKCKDSSQHYSPPVNIRDRRSSLDILNRFKRPNHHFQRQLTPTIGMEIERSIANVDKTINQILGYREAKRDLKSVSKKLRDKTNQLAEISDILKRELENISSNVRNNIKNFKFGRKKSSSESIWDEVNILHNMQQQSKNATEISEIRNVLDKVVDKLDINSKDHKVSGVYDMDEIKNKLQKISSNSNIGKDQENTNVPSTTQNVVNKITSVGAPTAFNDIVNKFHQEKSVHTDLLNTSKDLFSLDFDKLDMFNSFSKSGRYNKKHVDDAKKIIEDSQRTENILNNIFSKYRSGPDVFNNTDMFNFGDR